jgi:hypothetical protein
VGVDLLAQQTKATPDAYTSAITRAQATSAPTNQNCGSKQKPINSAPSAYQPKVRVKGEADDQRPYQPKVRFQMRSR